MPTIHIADLTLDGQGEESIYGTFESLTATPSQINRGGLNFSPHKKEF